MFYCLYHAVRYLYGFLENKHSLLIAAYLLDFLAYSRNRITLVAAYICLCCLVSAFVAHVRSHYPVSAIIALSGPYCSILVAITSLWLLPPYSGSYCLTLADYHRISAIIMLFTDQYHR